MQTKKELSFRSDLMRMNEDEFLTFIKDKAAVSGKLADCFCDMVAYNVPLFLLHNFFPEKMSELEKDPGYPVFIISEDDWKGNPDRIRSVLQGRSLRFTKNHALCGQHFIIGARIEDSMALVPVRESGWNWEERPEKHLTFEDSSGNLITHYRVSGQSAADGYSIFSDREYLSTAARIMRREITSLAFVAAGLSEFFNKNATNNGDMNLYCEEELVLIEQQRNLNAIDGQGLEAATSVIKRFLLKAEENGHQLEEFWSWMRDRLSRKTKIK